MRRLKQEIRRHLEQTDFEPLMPIFAAMPARRAVNPLLGFFFDRDERVRWHAISAFGVVLASLADRDMESARIVFRRLMWQLNDESGGIGWGVPEAMGESLARQSRLASEYSKILISYVMPGGNFLEHETLQSGVLWGIGRLSAAMPRQAAPSGPFVLPFLECPRPAHRGLAAMILGCIRYRSALATLQTLSADAAEFSLYRHFDVELTTVAELAASAVRAITS